MAKLCLGICTSHGPMLSTPPEQWGLRAEADRANPRHYFRGQALSFAELERLRSPGFAAQIVADEQYHRFLDCQSALDTLAERFTVIRPDLAIIVGNDQREVFKDDLTPAFTVYAGEHVENIPLTDEQRSRLPPGIAEAGHGHCPAGGAVYPGAAPLAETLTRSLVAQGFDVAVSRRLGKWPDRQHGIPHAFGFVYRRLMRDAPPPTIPVFVNVGVPPNQPTAARCLALGRAISVAVGELPSMLRVALIGSGGLSHFVIDEELDQRVLNAMKVGDEAALAAIPEDQFLGNTAEIKNWLPVVAAMGVAHFRMTLVDYVPCYRTQAGTGNAMAFAYWDQNRRG